METLKTYLEALQFACQDKSCAPPPVGTGGSKPAGGGGAASEAARKAKMVAMARGGGWRPNVERSHPGASRVAADAGEVMAKVVAASKINPDTREDGLPGKEHGDDQLLSAIYQARGFNKPATMLDSEDFAEFLQENKTTHLEAWRGVDTGPVAAYTNEIQAERAKGIATSFHESDVHWVGRGILGNGTYFATNTPGSADGLARSVDESSRYSNKQNTVQIHAAIDTYNFATYEHISQVGTVIHRLTNGLNGTPPPDQMNDTPADLHVRGAQSRNRDQWINMTEREVAAGMEVVRQGLDAGLTVSEINTITRDAGRLSAIMGYDGLSTAIVPKPGQSEYTVVHNRGAVTLDETIYTTRLKDPTNQYPTHRDERIIEPHPTWNR